MEQIINYIKPELIVVAIALYFIGMAIKQSETIADKYIPSILGLSAKEISDNEGTSLETMQKFAEEHAAEIEQKKAELKEGGWYE